MLKFLILVTLVAYATCDDLETIVAELRAKAKTLDAEVDVNIAKISGLGFLEAQAQHLRDMKATLDKIVFSLDFATNVVAANVLKKELDEFEVRFRAELDAIAKAIKAHDGGTQGPTALELAVAELKKNAAKLEKDIDSILTNIHDIGFLESEAQHFKDMKTTIDNLVNSLDHAANEVELDKLKGQLSDLLTKFRTEVDIVAKAHNIPPQRR